MLGPVGESDNARPLFGAEHTREGSCLMSDGIRGMEQNARDTRTRPTPTQ
jgi:hypothetical protein